MRWHYHTNIQLVQINVSSPLNKDFIIIIIITTTGIVIIIIIIVFVIIFVNIVIVSIIIIFKKSLPNKLADLRVSCFCINFQDIQGN